MRVAAACTVLLIATILPQFQLLSQSTSTSSIKIQAVRAHEPILIDGMLSESVWQRPAFSDFKQRDPDQGAPPTERTEVWVAYDEDALYVAARMYDSAPDSIMRVLSRRDVMLTADWIGVFLDPYYDRRTGFYFVLSASGTLADGVLMNDDWDDNSWDGVWEGKSHIDEKGWTAEFRIPFSQLRFHQTDTYLWAINFRRDIGRKNETDYVVYTPRNESGFVSRFVDLVGIENVQPRRQLEVMPYVNTRAEYVRHLPGDPFNSGSRYVPGVGADLKLGLGPNLTLDATLNPDFGQVEVDPAVVNLSDVETFFDEKRPFFIEGANIFNFGRGGSNSYWNFNFPYVNHFYSRRIGRTPKGSVPEADYIDAPLGTHILGAGKLSGKLGDNWSIGTIHAVTAREFADLQVSGSRSRIEIEPPTYYGIARAQKEFNGGREALGFMTTYARRMFSDDRLRDEMNSDGLFAGLDGYTFFDSEKEWVITGWAGLSRVTGNTARMIQLQQNSQHYFQRPDAVHVKVDSSTTSLTGYAGRFWINKQKGQLYLNAAFGVIDPSFEINDVGFLGRTDAINYHTVVGYRWTEPNNIFRNLNIVAAYFQNLDFDGNTTGLGYFHNGFIRLLNYWSVNWVYVYNPETVNNRRTRGGPLTLNLPGREFDFGISSDDRKPIVFDIFVNSYQRTNEPSYFFEAGLQWKPAPNISLRIGPNFSLDRSEAQWVGVFPDRFATATFDNRYVFARLDQKTLSASIRLNWTFTPELSLQLYAQPLISAGSYTHFKELARPKSFDFNEYGKNGSTLTKIVAPDGSVSYDVDPDGNGPAPMFSFSDPSFNIKSLRGNAVLRWEYRPGSTLYLVWTQSRSDFESVGDFEFNHSMVRLFGAEPDNIFMLKFSYWWSL